MGLKNLLYRIGYHLAYPPKPSYFRGTQEEYEYLEGFLPLQRLIKTGGSGKNALLQGRKRRKKGFWERLLD